MKTKLKKLALTAMLLSGTSVAMADNGKSIIGDLPGYGEDAYFGEDAAYSDETEIYGNEVVAYTEDDTVYAPVQGSHLHSTQMQSPSYSAYSGDCGCGSSDCGGGCGAEMGYSMGTACGCESASCNGGCGSSCGTSRRMSRMFNQCDTNAWASLEALLWFAQPRDLPPLVLGSDSGTLPVLGGPGNVQTLFGGEGQNELSAGFRVDGGLWLTEHVGVGGRFWMLDESGSDFNYDGDGNGPSVGRSFFNTSGGAVGEDALLVNLQGIFLGDLQAESSLDIRAVEAYGRFRFGSGKNCNLDFIGGYSHFDIDDSLSINSSTTNLINNGGNTAGTTRTFSDRFEADNTFNGGQLGFDMIMHRGRWTASSLTKVHLGSMEQRVSSSGSYTRQIPGLGATGGSGGVLTGSTPMDLDRSVFAFAPEANFKIGYNFRPNVALTVGYSFIYFDNVALAGDAVNRNVQGNLIGTGNAGASPSLDFVDSSLWVQGVDLGVAINF